MALLMIFALSITLLPITAILLLYMVTKIIGQEE